MADQGNGSTRLRADGLSTRKMTERMYRLKPQQPPDLSDRMRRAAWQIVWSIAFRPSPVVLHGWRRMILRCFGAKVARSAHPYPTCKVWAPWNLEMDERSCLGPSVNCYNVDTVALGPGAIVSQFCHICTASHDFESDDFPLVTAPISIGKGAWVAADAFVGPGVDVGDEAVVLARSVVTKDVGKGTVVGGHPAAFIRQRNAPDEVPGT